MEGQALLSIVFDAIADDDINKVKEICSKFPLNQISVNASDSLLSRLLNVCVENDRSSCASIIYSVWQESNPEEERYSLLTYMLGRPIFSSESILMVLMERSNLTRNRIFDEIISRDDSPETLTSLTRFFEILGIPSYDDLLKMKAEIVKIEQEEDVPMPRMRGFIDSYIEEQSKPVSLPTYLLDNDLTEEEIEGVSVELSTKVSDLSLEEKADLLTEGMNRYGITIEEIDRAKEIIKKDLLDLNLEDQQFLLNPVLEDLNIKDLTEDKELFKRFGPAHAVYGTILDDSEIALPCSQFGGCRMFLCVCSETLQDDDELGKSDVMYDTEETDWYRGACDFCHRKIQKRVAAARRPLDNGGWVGCYCSWKCTRDDIPSEDLVMHALSDRFEDKCHKIGIYDRKYE